MSGVGFRATVSRALAKDWTVADLDKYMGSRKATYLGHASAEEIRGRAASGGVVTALLADLFERDEIDGALVCSTSVRDGRVSAEYSVATSAEEAASAQGSTYVATDFARGAMPLIRASEAERLAVVGLPCDLTVLAHHERKDPALAGRIALRIGLLCGHNSEPELIDSLTSRLRDEASGPLTGLRFRTGHWRGRMEARFEDGTLVEKPFSYFSLYQNLYFFAQRKCIYCHDHFAYDADISVGDVWIPALKEDPIKRSGVLVKTERGVRELTAAEERGVVVLEEFDPATLMEGQARTGPFHYNISARSRAGRLLGMRIPDPVGEKVRWHEYIAAVIVLANWRATRGPRGRRLVLAIPRPLLKGYLYVFKGLESL